MYPSVIKSKRCLRIQNYAQSSPPRSHQQAERIRRLISKGMTELAISLTNGNREQQTWIVKQLLDAGNVAEALAWRAQLALPLALDVDDAELQRRLEAEAESYLTLPDRTGGVHLVDCDASFDVLVAHVFECVPLCCCVALLFSWRCKHYIIDHN